MKKVTGRFYFKKTDNGNLQGEYSNNFTTKVYTESATIISDYTGKNNFVGSYNASWVESNEIESFSACLEINKKENSINIYSLIWKHSENILFTGEAMLSDGMLIGNYQNQKEGLLHS